MANISPGDIIELVPDETPEHYGYWLEGQGLVLSMDSKEILIQMFFLNKINKKNFSVIELKDTRLSLDTEKVSSSLFKILA
jgi:hypothetical protein